MGAALEYLTLGFATALTPSHLLGCVAGVFVGTLIGVLPGLGPVTTIALLLPFTFSLSPTAAVIMLAGIYYGAQYGGSITAILVNVPGEASSTVTCLDGYAMARQGRAGVALATAAIGSFIGGTIGTIVLATLSAPLASLAARFEAADYAALMACGLAAAVALASGSMVKALAMVTAGVLLGQVGTDVTSGQSRFTMGVPELLDGIGFMPLAIGLFALAEIIETIARPADADAESSTNTSEGAWPRPGEARRAAAASVRGTMLGSVLGILPGAGPLLASFASYALEKRMSPRAPFGRGAIEGVAGPESANNAAAQTAFVPLLTLGLPSNAVMALLLGALIVHGIQPGPGVIAREPALFWGLVASMWIGNLLLLVINLPLVGLWRRLLRIPYRFLYPATIVLCCMGVYTLNHSTFELLLTACFGVLGYVLRVWRFEPTPLLLGFVLSQPLEEHFRRALMFSHGDPTTFVTHPVSATLLAVSALLVVTMGYRSLRVVEDHARGVTAAGAQAADAVSQVDAIDTARALDRAVVDGKDDGVTAPERDDFGA
jgi:putative tricarboxylic transport membrane protein